MDRIKLYLKIAIVSKFAMEFYSVHFLLLDNLRQRGKYQVQKGMDI